MHTPIHVNMRIWLDARRSIEPEFIKHFITCVCVCVCVWSPRNCLVSCYHPFPHVGGLFFPIFFLFFMMLWCDTLTLFSSSSYPSFIIIITIILWLCWLFQPCYCCLLLLWTNDLEATMSIFRFSSNSIRSPPRRPTVLGSELSPFWWAINLTT